jgi:hypothetical protein
MKDSRTGRKTGNNQLVNLSPEPDSQFYLNAILIILRQRGIQVFLNKGPDPLKR